MCKGKTESFRRTMCMFTTGEYALEAQGAILMLLIGVWLFFNDTFQVSAVYRIMASIGSENFWSALFIFIATVQILAIKYDERAARVWKVTLNGRWIRKHVLLLKGAVWFTLFMGVITGDARALSAPMFFVFSCNAFRSFFCIGTVNLDEKPGM